MTQRIILSLGASIAMLMGCTNVPTQTEPTELSTFSFSELSCWDLVTSPEQDANFAYTLIYGYVAGQKSQALQKQSVVQRVTLAAIEDCEANPDKSALQAFSDHWEIDSPS